jgi:hypothetical protein
VPQGGNVAKNLPEKPGNYPQESRQNPEIRKKITAESWGRRSPVPTGKRKDRAARKPAGHLGVPERKFRFS